MNNKIIKAKLKVKENLINVMRINNTDYISLDEINSFDELIEKINSAKPNFCYHYCKA